MPSTQAKAQTGDLNMDLEPEEAIHNNPVSHICMTSGAQASSTKQLSDLNVTNLLASIVHQADKHGKQQPLETEEHQGSTTRGSQGSFRSLFANIFLAVGIIEQQQHTLTKQPHGRSSLTKSKAASKRTSKLYKNVLPPSSPNDADKKCLVLDLDETLVHSSYRPTANPYLVIPIDIDGTIHQVYVCKRPGAEEFLIEMAKYYEIVVYTASLSKYADPLLDKLDPEGVIRYRLYREHCVQYEESYVKDLSLLDRDVSQTIIIDNAPMSYIFHPRNAIGCSSFIDDPSDCELESISRFLINFHDVEDVRDHLHIWDAHY
ncbi:hypothetical protein DD237_007607 [Peronospora effusa]|uniref:protein-serine/threonine phosphatase n=1 Tax=Peronospora effusa TaxID=542832 RepID=A0A3R7WV73_9STRA|nr:hypothetical protein DD237_007607 [Peronospora effusa]